MLKACVLVGLHHNTEIINALFRSVCSVPADRILEDETIIIIMINAHHVHGQSFEGHTKFMQLPTRQLLEPGPHQKCLPVSLTSHLYV